MTWSIHVVRVEFIESYCKEVRKYKVSVHIDPSFDLMGSGTRDCDPALWITPGSLDDPWPLAHEFAHALQFTGMGLPNRGYVGWFQDHHANFMAHSLPEFHSSNVNCTELFVYFPLIYLGSARSRYVTQNQSAPQRWGHYLVQLFVHLGVTAVEAQFRGVVEKAAVVPNLDSSYAH